MGDIVQRFTTEADTGGIDDIKSGLADVTEATSKASQTMGSNFDMSSSKFDSFSKRIERPIAAIAFSGVAEQLSDIGSKGESTGVMIEHALHAAGSAITFFNAPLGLAVIGGTALFEVFEKMNAAKTSEEFGKEADALEKENKSAKELIPVLLLKSDISKQAKQDLIEELKASDESVESFKRRYEFIESETKFRNDNYIPALKKTIEALTDQNAVAGDGQTKAQVTLANLDQTSQRYISLKNALSQLSDATKKQTEDQNFLTGSEKAYIDLQKQKTDSKADEDVIKKQTDLSLQYLVATSDLITAKKGLATWEQKEADIERQIIASTDIIRTKDLEKQLDNAKTIEQLYNQQVQDLGGLKQKQDDILSSMTGAWVTYAQSIGTAIGQGSQSANSVFRQLMSDQLKILGDGLIKQLTAKATAAGADPLTAGIALAEIAAISAIEAITGSSGGSSSTSSSTASSQPINSQTTNVMVNLQGASLSDASAIAVIMKGITKQVVQNNGQVVTTQVAGNGVSPPGSLA